VSLDRIVKSNLPRIAVIGFGEAGRIFAGAFVAAGVPRVAVYDILFDGKDGAPVLKQAATAAGAVPCDTPAAAALGADVILAAVTASSALEAATTAAGYIAPGQVYLDVNSVAPSTKRAAAARIERAGGRYVEAAVMASVPPYGLRVPMLFGGPWGRMLAERLQPLGMAIEVFDRDIGYVSAVKMCRSVMIKGIEALVVEAMTAAHEYGVEDQVLASLDETFPGLDWQKQAAYMAGRVVKHGKRRAEEMREAAKAVADIGLEPLMASATAERQQWVADRIASNRFDGTKPALADFAQVFRGQLKGKAGGAS
jgi:3-hydroxyisobutyrate dehydrogenase-like beta-hydroxyacid dehydrogenase